MSTDITNDEEDTQQKKRPIVLYVSAVLIALFVLWGFFSPTSLQQAAGNALGWMIDTFGWFYMLITAFFVLFIIVLAISPFGNIKLGKEDDEPEFSWFSWIGMLFAAGIGVGFVFWGVAEPVLHYLQPPVGYEPETIESAVAGLRYGVFHWAFHPWAIFSIVGLTLAYVQFRLNRPALISSAFYPLLGHKVNGVAGQTIDTLAVLATCTGVATTFGLSALQMSAGISHLTPIPNNIWTQIVIIVIVTFCFIISSATGLDKGIRLLSNINIVVAAILLLFVLSIGPTIFILENFVTTIGGYITNFLRMSLTLTPYSDSEWLGANTIFFWAWHISWAPFMGLFIARISKGRTIREFIAGVLIAPAVLALIWFTTFGSTGLHIEIYGNGGLAELVSNEVEIALFAMLAELPLGLITSTISMFLIFIFFVTSADSATYVLASMTSNGTLNPTLPIKLLWGFLMAGTASVLLLSGGGGLDALQTASIIAALPFSIIMVLMILAMLILLKRDWDKNYKPIQIKHSIRKRNVSLKDQPGMDLIYEEVTTDLYKKMKDEIYEDMYVELKEEIIKEVQDEQKEDIYNRNET